MSILIGNKEKFETFDITEIGRSLIFELTADSDNCEERREESQEIKKYSSFRDHLMAGDYPCLYIAWLAHVRDTGEEYEQPPILAGMKMSCFL